MTVSRKDNFITFDFFGGNNEIFDCSNFDMPPECFTSMDEYCHDKEIDFKEYREKTQTIDCKEHPIESDYEFAFASIMDMSEMMPGEIEIEDEIRMGYLWKKYRKKTK